MFEIICLSQAIHAAVADNISYFLPIWSVGSENIPLLPPTSDVFAQELRLFASTLVMVSI